MIEPAEDMPAQGVIHLIAGSDLMALLDRCYAGEDPEWVYMEMFVNGERLDSDEGSGTKAS